MPVIYHTYGRIGGGWGKGIRVVCVGTIVLPFGMRTRFPQFSSGTLLSHGQVVGGDGWCIQSRLSLALMVGLLVYN